MLLYRSRVMRMRSLPFLRMFVLLYLMSLCYLFSCQTNRGPLPHSTDGRRLSASPYTYIGCYSENWNDRDLKVDGNIEWTDISASTDPISDCLAYCSSTVQAKYPNTHVLFFGLQYNPGACFVGWWVVWGGWGVVSLWCVAADVGGRERRREMGSVRKRMNN
eukprot:GDKI01010284.1.p1 GENE.GDKI01010284.1~~GDKI01010284.1.p1  ORF type:complete len:162 (-),score=36.52 GDKI01010284.1:30-515(-)